MALFNNLRLMTRMKKPKYSEPQRSRWSAGWNEEDFHAGKTTYDVSNYEGTARLKITTPTRPATLHRPHLRTSPRPTRWLGGLLM